MTESARHLDVESLLPSGDSKRSGVLLVADLVTFIAVMLSSFVMALIARFVFQGTWANGQGDDPQRVALMFVPALIILLWRSWSLGHYSQYRPVWQETQEVIGTVFLIAAFDAFMLYVMGILFSRLWFGFFLIELCILIPLSRLFIKEWLIRRGQWHRSTLIVGVGENARNTALAIESDPSLGHRVDGFVDLSLSSDGLASYRTDNKEKMAKIDGKPVLSELPLPVRGGRTRAPSLVFAFESLEELDGHRSVLNECIASSAFVSVAPPPMGLPLYGASLVGIFRQDTSLLRITNKLMSPRARFIKRITDLVGGVFCAVVLSPVILLIALLVARDGGSVLYQHRRVGKGNVAFPCFKFRSMVENSDAALESHLAEKPAARIEWQQTRKLRDDPRVTRIGRYLRQTSLDELPQLINVMRGEMSLVGPRPVTEEECVLYGEFLPYYLMMTPGMTGLWQVSGRTDTSYAERVRLDVWYSRHWSLWNDLVILVQTVRTLAQRHGAY